MEELTDRENLFKLWMIYNSKKERVALDKFLQFFIKTHKEFIDIQFDHLNEGFCEEGPHLTLLPDGILEVLGNQLVISKQQITSSFTEEKLKFTESLLECLIVICRNYDNVPLVASCEFVSNTVAIAASVIEQICGDEDDESCCSSSLFLSFIQHVIHLLECLYDPYFIWRKRLRGWKVDKTRQRFKPACLHNEVVPFFHDCFQQEKLVTGIQLQLLHLFGAIISGAQHNALKAITPATLDVLLKVLSSNRKFGPTNTNREEISTLKDLVLKCIVRVVHVIHCCSPDQRQIEVSEVMQGYMNVLQKLELEESDNDDQDTHLQLTMISTVDEMLSCNDKGALQVLLVSGGTFNSFVSLLQKTSLTGSIAQSLAISVIKVIQTILAGSNNAKCQVNYEKFVDAMRSLGQPSIELLKSLLDLVVEEEFVEKDNHLVHNTKAAVMLLQWLPDIQSHDLQIWLSYQLKCLCGRGHRNRMNCCNAGMVGAILGVLGRQRQIDPKAVSNLIKLTELLGTHSIQASELKQLIALLRLDEESVQMPYCTRLMRAISTMARRDGRDGALQFFDIQSRTDGLVLPTIKKWPGPGYTIHCWLCLDTEFDLSPYHLHDPTLFRRQLYNISGSHGNGIEGFFTPDGTLVIGVYSKKEYCTLTLENHQLSDNLWHCIDITHTSSRRPFTNSQVTIYIDGRQKLTAQLKFPNLTDPLCSNRIGSPGIKSPLETSTELTATTPTATEPKLPSTLKRFFQVSPKSTPAQQNVSSIPSGMQDDIWGSPITIHGQIGSICIFHDAISQNQVRSLYSIGPNHMTLFNDDSELFDLPGKLLCHYNAKACKENICIDLSNSQNHAILAGQKCVTWDIKDVVNCVGGIQVLFPLLEQVDKIPAARHDSPDSSNMIESSVSEENDEWVIVPSSSYADANLEQNQVSAFLTMLRNMLQTKPINQDSFVINQGAATIGALLQKVDPKLIDVHVLMAVQLLKDAFMQANKQLLYHLYQYILFDFRIWSKSDFPVRIGHIQYLATIIKDERQYFRKKYGVQYILDVIRTYYSGSNGYEEDGKTIRVSLLTLVKYYITHDIKQEECSQIIAFLLLVKEEELVRVLTVFATALKIDCFIYVIEIRQGV
ncbi:neurobeachin-like protein 1 [Patella vulgata]|uniref:neurobeachin-like protein 1 n=1 Tax=Patella vulgata TaxID=6465 RepID=UPI0024A9025C|nr:neurobeachin-like protein 1 [Patella vulgata]